MYWYIYYTYPKVERILRDYFNKANFEVFLPLHKVKRQWSDRVKVLEVPLFTNYIFIKSDKHDIYNIIKHPKIIKYVAFGGCPAYLKEDELCLIKKITNNCHNIEIDPTIRTGDMVKIKSGSLKGLTGILLEKKGSKRFGIRIYELNQTLSIEINIDLLEKVEIRETSMLL